MEGGSVGGITTVNTTLPNVASDNYDSQWWSWETKVVCLQVPTVIFFTDSELGRAGRGSSQVGTETILFVIG